MSTKTTDPNKSIGDCPFDGASVIPASDSFVYAHDPASDDPMRPLVPTHQSCGFRYVREHKCPRCGESDWSLSAQAYASLEFKGVVRQRVQADGDSFMGLTCEKCKLSLVGEPGDGRIRRATLRDAADGLDVDEVGNLPEIDNDEWTVYLMTLADFAIELFR